MAQLKLQLQVSTHTAILSAPDSELKEILLEGRKLLIFDSEILIRIGQDIDAAAKIKKANRIEDQHYYDQLNGTIPSMKSYLSQDPCDTTELVLLDGRPRLLDPESLFYLMLCRAHLDSVTSIKAIDRLKDSVIMQSYFESRGMRLPSPNTILDNINAVTNDTRDYIYNAEMRMITNSGWDSMDLVTVDSFSVSGNSDWPTDSRIILKLLRRCYRIGSHHIPLYGLPGFTSSLIPRWLQDLGKLDFDMSNVCGKSGSKRKLKKLYRRYFHRVNKVVSHMMDQVSRYLSEWENPKGLSPRRHRMAKALIDRIILDIEGVIRVYSYAEDRVFRGITLPGPEKILSLSDECASFIKKGGREPVIGYKPQIVRSGKGFITAFEIEQGNPSDASRLVPLIEQHCANTATLPHTVSADDGYSSTSNRNNLLKEGVQTVSISGSKGKKITPESEWESLEYKEARRIRSAVESIVFVLRYKFHLGSFTRREIDGVRAEMTEKVITHNLWRISYLRQKERLLQAA